MNKSKVGKLIARPLEPFCSLLITAWPKWFAERRGAKRGKVGGKWRGKSA